LSQQETEPQEDFTIPGVPQFTYQDSVTMEFPLLVKKTQRRSDCDEWHEEEDDSSSSRESVFSDKVTVKASIPAQDFHSQRETKNEDARYVFLLPHVGLTVCALSSGSSVLVRTIVVDIKLCSWARHFTLIVPLSTQVTLRGYPF